MTKPYLFNAAIKPPELKEALSERIHKAASLVETGVLDHVMETASPEVGHFLWIVVDLMKEIKELHERLSLLDFSLQEAS